MANKGINRIITSIDGSSLSRRVVERAADMAATFQAKVILLHVRQKVPDILGEPYYQKVLNKYTDSANGITAPLKTLLEERGVENEVLVLEGDPAEAIVGAANDENCDLIVMGTRGLSNLQRVALGSVSHKVLQAAECMVLIVP